ncbi:hypothetical protein Avbf_08193 [Armadillidium vulgare]|nr:hypothetical protein Avbf_08193 [Armadillidium vulgare]
MPAMVCDCLFLIATAMVHFEKWSTMTNTYLFPRAEGGNCIKSTATSSNGKLVSIFNYPPLNKYITPEPCKRFYFSGIDAFKAKKITVGLDCKLRPTRQKNDTDRTTIYVTKSKNFTHFITHATSSHLYYDHSHNRYRIISNFFLWYFPGSLFIGTLYVSNNFFKTDLGRVEGGVFLISPFLTILGLSLQMPLVAMIIVLFEDKKKYSKEVCKNKEKLYPTYHNVFKFIF